MTALLPSRPESLGPRPRPSLPPSLTLADAGPVVQRRRGSLVMRSTDEGDSPEAFYTPVVPESPGGEFAGVTPTSRLKEKLRRSLRLQVAVGLDLVEQYKGKPRKSVEQYKGVERAPPQVVKSPRVEADGGGTPNCSPFAVYMNGLNNPLVVNSRARFWKIVSDHGWSDHQVNELRKSFSTFAVEGQSEAMLAYDGFEKLLPELLKIDPRDILQARVRRYWTYMDTEQKGEVNFEDFFIWYLKYMHTDLDRSKQLNAPSTTPSARFPISPSELIKRSGTKSLVSRSTVDF